MLSAQLKEQTKVNHQLLEKKLVAQMRSIQNKEDYSKLLNSFYSFFGGLEILMSKHEVLSFLTDQSQRRKSSALANDLNHLDAHLPNLATQESLPVITNYLQIIGVMYVMEGSTLGGKYIAKMIQSQLNSSDCEGLSFFNSYGENTENMWQIFKESIDGIHLNQTDSDTVVLAANDTFQHFSNWFDQIS